MIFLKTSVIVVGNEFLVSGMKLAGIQDAIITDNEHFQSVMEKIIADKNYGVVIIPESMYNELDWRLRSSLETGVRPLIIQIPEPGTKSMEGDRIRALIKRAIGFDVMAKKKKE